MRYNILINNGINSLRICNQNTNLLAHNNLIYHDDPVNENSLVFTHLSDRTTQGPTNSVLVNNIFYTTNNNGMFTADVESTDPRFEEVIYSHNLFYGIDAAYQYPNDVNKVVGDPLFVDETVPTQDIGGYVLLDEEGLPTGNVSYDFLTGFGLSDLSPAINAGTSSSISEIPLVDFANNAALVGTSLDIGPFENQNVLSTINAVKNNSISLYPNPVSNTLNIKVPYGNTITKVSISNSLGQLIMKDNAPKASIDLEGLCIKTGIYFVRIESSLGVTIKKIIKE